MSNYVLFKDGKVINYIVADINHLNDLISSKNIDSYKHINEIKDTHFIKNDPHTNEFNLIELVK